MKDRVTPEKGESMDKRKELLTLARDVEIMARLLRYEWSIATGKNRNLKGLDAIAYSLRKMVK